MKGWSIATAIAAAALAMAPAHAAVIGFDDLGTTGDAIENGYAGLEWTNMFVLDPTDAPAGGYRNAVQGGTRAAFAGFDSPATIGALDAFVLESGWFTAAFNDGMTVTAQGFDGSRLIHELSFTIDTSGPTQQTFNWGGISRVTFSSAGGTGTSPDMTGTNFALDSLAVAAVPEPSTWAMMLLGFGAVAVSLRRRRATATT
jgi:hypothetical protein